MLSLQSLVPFTLALGLGAAELATAHRGCGGHEIMRRNPGGPVINSREELRSLQSRPRGSSLMRKAVTDEASAAESTGESMSLTLCCCANDYLKA